MTAAPGSGHIVWLASYPKSGNTWMRAFLSNYLADGVEPVDINSLDTGGPIASARAVFDEAVGVEASDLTQDEIERYRPRAYRQMAANSSRTIYLKIHDAFTYTAEGSPLIPPDATKSVLYLIRNPLDVAVSFAHHSAASATNMIAKMCDPEFAFVDRGDRLYSQLRQRLLTWSGHVVSWVDEPALDVLVVRYEDMKLHSLETFRSTVAYLGLEDDVARIDKALAFSSFAELQRQEQEHGFKEKMLCAESFFRRGEVGRWREVLTPEDVAGIIAPHGEVMRRFGYLTGDGGPAY